MKIVLQSLSALGLCCLTLACANKATAPVAQLDDKERLTRGCVFYLDGAGGGTAKTNYAAGVISGLKDAGFQGAEVMISWETGKGLMADQKASVAYKRLRAKEIADKIVAYKKEHPQALVGILGFSAGTAEAVFALELLPPNVQVDTVVLLGASISHDYDMTDALKHVSGKLHVFTSPHDHMLSVAMPLSGTADRKFHDAGAGIHGFSLPKNAGPVTKKLYDEKIVTTHYSNDFRKDGDRGHHFDNVKEKFIADEVAPIFIGQQDPIGREA